ncbi:MAG: hypothetical protein U1A78_28150 [Polyangia bacterium]
MRRGSLIWVLPATAFLLLSGGCSNTVRYLTSMSWVNTPAGPTGAAAAQGAPAGATAATAATAAAPGGGGGDGTRTLYITYWEGSCSSGILGFGRGCSLGDSKIRRCNVNTDNSLECVDEAEATRAFARQK